MITPASSRRFRITTVRLALLFALTAGVSTVVAVVEMRAAESESRRAHDALRVDNVLARVTLGLNRSFGTTRQERGHGDRVRYSRQDVERMLFTAAQLRRKATATCVAVASLSFVYALLVWVISRDQLATLQAVGLVALLWLLLGLTAPMMSVTLYQELPVLGTVVLRHDTKNILDVADALLKPSTWPVGVVLLLCGILAPFVKLAALQISLLVPSNRISSLARAVGDALAPWAMVDVFTVAIAITFFGIGSDPSVRAVLEPGAYFFTGHCILAIGMAHSLRLAARCHART